MVKVLDREKIKRMTGAGSGVVGSSGGGDVDLSGYATQIWTTENFVSIEFFRELFRAYDSNSQEILPNDTTSVVASIKAMVGTWTEEYLTALGNAGGGGGGGGGAQYLNDLLDVQLTTPLTDGQALVYNATLQKWVNGAAGVNMTTVWNALAGSTNEQINASHLSTALSGYVTTSAISDMATQTWVGQQGFATQTWVTSNFITIAYFDRLFRAYNNSTLVSHNDTTSTIDNIKAMFGFWTEFYLSALGTGGVSSVSISLSQLADVNVAGVTNNQLLGYDSTNAEWVNTPLKTINGNSIIGTGDLTISGVSTLSGLTDVALSSPTTYQVLMYDANTTKWYNSALKTINGQPLYGSGDISVGGGASGNYLPLSGGTLTGVLKINLSESGWATQAFCTSLSNHRFVYGIGKADSANNMGYYGYHHVANGSTSNYLTMGLYAKDELVNILANGNVGIGTVSPATRLEVVSTVGHVVRITSSDTYDTYIQCILGSTLRAEVGYSHNMSFLSCQPSGGRIGVNDSGYPVYRTTWNGTESKLIHSGTNYLNEATLLLSNTSVTGRIMSILWGNYASLYNCSYISHHCVSVGSSSNYVTFGLYGADELLNITGYGSVGIGTAGPSYKLHVVGDIYATGGVTALSDIRHKTVIRDAAVSVEDIARMPAVMYQWNDGREDKELHVGSIAQNWQTVLPEVVLKANDEEGTLSMQYGVAALVSSIIIARKVVNHEERIKQLEKENEELKKRLNIA